MDLQKFKFTSGEGHLKQHDDSDTITGGVVNRWFSSHYGSPMLTRSLRVPGIAVVNVGLFDEVWDWSFVEEISGVSDACKYDDLPDKRGFEIVHSAA